MAGQQVHTFVHGERHITVGTLWNPTASAALYHRREASSVLKEDDLQPALQRFIHGSDERWRERTRHHLAPLQILRVHYPNLWQLNVLVPRGQSHQSIFALAGVIIAFHRRCGRPQQGLRTIHPCQNDGCRPCMIAWRGVLLLERSFVFFINNDQPEPLKRQEHGTARTQYHLVGMVRKLFFPYFNAFGIAIFRMVDAQFVAKHMS